MATRLTPVQIFQVLREAGFTPDQAVNFTAIAMAESGGNPRARLHTSVEDSRGLWQINTFAHPHYRDDNLYDPLTNARAAYAVSNHGKNLYPWSTTHHTRGEASYEKFLPLARKAAADAGSAPAYRPTVDTDTAGGDRDLRGVDHVRPIENGKLSDTWHAARPGGHVHEGIDIFAKTGTPIHAVTGGKIVRGFSDPRGGVVVRIEGDDGRYYYYAHLKPGSTDDLRIGQRVRTGEVIGQVGKSGDAATTPPHLHLQVKSGNEWINPYDFLKPFPDMSTIESAGQIDHGSTGADAKDTALKDPDPYTPVPKPFVDTDRDGLSDDFEKVIGTNAKEADSDHDGLSDYQEAIVTHTDALSADTDHDGEGDALAVALGHNPGFVPLSPAAQAALAAGGAAVGVPAGGAGGAAKAGGDELTRGFEAATGVGGQATPGAGGTPGGGTPRVSAKYDPNLGTGSTGLPTGTQIGPDGGITVRQADGALLRITVERPDPTPDPLAHGGAGAHGDPGHA
jgi:murein DD-endopeptidase MepM/ murein hydrolase activator NlpD